MSVDEIDQVAVDMDWSSSSSSLFTTSDLSNLNLNMR